MTRDTMKVELSGISASMLGCLWGRAQLSKEYSSLFYDEKAVELVERIDYDFSASDVPFEDIWFNIARKTNLPELGLFNLRARQFDDRQKHTSESIPMQPLSTSPPGLTRPFTALITALFTGTTSTCRLSSTSGDSSFRNLTG